MTASLGIERILTPESPPVERPHILLIVIDALRRDHLGCYGYQRDTSPVIDRLSREGKKHFAVGQRLDFALMRSSKRQDQIAVEGFFDRMENQTEEVKIELFCEDEKLGETIIGKVGSNFLLSPELPDRQTLSRF